MSSAHRMLIGLEFSPGPVSAWLYWHFEAEGLVRLSIEIARVSCSGLAFAAVAVLRRRTANSESATHACCIQASVLATLPKTGGRKRPPALLIFNP